MKRTFLLFLMCLTMVVVHAQSWKLVISKTDGQTLEVKTSEVKDIKVVRDDDSHSVLVSDLTNSGCLSETRAGGIVPTLALRKEGNVVAVELLNYYSNCGTSSFHVSSSVTEGGVGGSNFVDVRVAPVIEAEADCYCNFNVTFNLNGIEEDSFYLSCWWFSGNVSFAESKEVRLEYTKEETTIDGVKYTLLTSTRQAIVSLCDDRDGELVIPAEVTNGGTTYTVTALEERACAGQAKLTRVVLPRTISYIMNSVSGAVNPFERCTALKAVEVEEGSHWFTAVDGVLYSKDEKVLYCYPIGSERTSYAIPESVEQIGIGAFCWNSLLSELIIPGTVTTIGNYAFEKATGLRTLVLPESATILGKYLFAGCNMESLFLKGEIDDLYRLWLALRDLNENTVIYVRPSMVDNVKKIFRGTVLPIEE